MSAESEEGRRVVGFLLHRLEGTDDVELIANAITEMLQEMNTALVPIIGRKGVAALHRRSFFICAGTNSFLAQHLESLVISMDLIQLKSLLASQNQAEAKQFGELLLTTAFELLASLIGPSLSTRLLFDVWNKSSSAPSAQESAP